jgi:sugar phosphate isomerase/epimerase
MMSLDELRDRISENQITQFEVMEALREPLAEIQDDCIRSKLKQAITSANIYYCSHRWGQYRTIEKAKARLIASIMKAAG